MNKECIKNTLFVRERELFVKEEDVTKIVNLIHNITRDNTALYCNVTTGKCEWVKAGNLYFIAFKASQNNYSKICEECGRYRIVLYPETVGYTGYQY